MNRPTQSNRATAGVDTRRGHYSRDARAKAIDRLALVNSAEGFVPVFAAPPIGDLAGAARASARLAR